MTELFEDFYERYEKPVVEPLTVGYSGIDPPLNPNSYGLDHECLDGLLGGNDDGHYHLTKKQLRRLAEIYEKRYAPEIFPYQSIDTVPNDEITPYQVQGRNVTLTP